MQRFNVLDPTINVLSHRFLEASAGTGKTFAIENLFVRWVLEGIPIGEILVVTFTKAATQELIERIHQRLQKALLDTHEEDKRLLLEAALSSYDEARIYTIHGFCQAMLQRYFVQSECDLRFSSAESAHRDALWGEWIDFLRAHIDSDKFSTAQLQRYFGGTFESGLRDLVKSWRPDIADPLPDFYRIPELIKEKMEGFGPFSAGKVFEDLENLSSTYNAFTSYQEQYRIFATWCERREATQQEIESILGQEALFLEKLSSAEKKKKPKEVSWNYPGLAFALQQAFLPLFSDLRDKAKIKQKLCFAFSSYRSRFGTSPATPDELLIAMQSALDNEEFLQTLRRQFSAVVIDEFQDTDQVQWNIFSRLFMKKGVLKAFCLVGDPKQSIYAFRNADLYTYIEAKQGFALEEHATLSVNYRSVSPLVEALNALFTDVARKGWMRLPKTGQELEIPKVEAAYQENGAPLSIGNVHVVIAHKGEKQLFAYIAMQIAFWKERNILPKDMAILVKDRYEARKLIRFLSHLEIKAHYPSQGHLADTPTFEALVDLFALLEKPRDRSRLKKVLAGSLVSWSQERLKSNSFSQALFGIQQLLGVFEENGLGACLQAFFEEAWSGNGRVADELLKNDAIERYEEFEQLAEILIKENKNWSLMQIRLFLEALRRQKDKEGAELDKRSSLDEDAVEITTIFRSKGLEYEIVFPLALASSKLKKDEDEEKKAEKMRLLYVALTRAKKCVYLPWIPCENIEEPSITDLFFADWDPALGVSNILTKLAALGAECAITVEELNQEVDAKPIKGHELIAQVPKPSEFTRRFAPRCLSSFSSMKRKESIGSIPEIKADLESLPVGAETGTFVHAILEKIFLASLHHPYQKEKIAELIRKAVDDEKFLAPVEEVVDLIDQVFQLELKPLCSDKKPFVLSEVPSCHMMPEMEFVYPEENNLLIGFIDLIFMQEGQYYIVDWKTNWLPDYSPEQIEASMQRSLYYLQAKIYAEALKRYIKLFDERPFEECFGGAYYLYLRGKKWMSFMP